MICCLQSIRSGISNRFTAQTSRTQIGSRAQYYRLTFIDGSCKGFDTCDLFFMVLCFLPKKLTDFCLFDQQIFLIFQHFTHGSGIFRFIRLCTQRMYGRSLGHIQHFRLNKGLINIFTHLSSESIQFSDQMSLRRSSYIRITGH